MKRKTKSLIFSYLLAFVIVTSAAGQEYISGVMEGTLPAGTYIVVDTIWVNPATSLIIQPGTRMLMDSIASILVFGDLHAVGTASDSIYFIPNSDSCNQWMTIKFNRTDSTLASGELGYCHFSGASKGAVNVYAQSDVIIHNSTIDNCWATWGGGIYISFSSPIIRDCVISNNWCIGDGGGIYNTHSNTIIENCKVFNNYCYNGSTASGQGGGGICANHTSSPTITNCEIYDNYTIGRGGGIALSDSSNAIISGCIIYNNQSIGRGGGIFIGSCTPTIMNCTIVNNAADTSGGGIDINIYSTMYNCIPYIRNTIIANNLQAGVSFYDTTSFVDFCFNNIFGNSGGNFSGEFIPVPGALGLISTVNLNGDSCDMYYNLYSDPMLINAGGINYRLMTGSPCIDAGDPETGIDPDLTIKDMGAVFTENTVSIIRDVKIFVNEGSALLQWTPVQGAIQYNIYRSDEPFFETTGLSPIATSSTPNYLDIGAAVGNQQWFYIVKWEN